MLATISRLNGTIPVPGLMSLFYVCSFVVKIENIPSLISLIFSKSKLFALAASFV